MALLRAATLPCHAVTDEPHRATCSIALGIDAHIAEQRPDMHGRVPSTVPRCAAPLSICRLEGEYSCAPTPWVATFARSAAISCAGALVRSRITCQQIEGSESSSHGMTELFGEGLTKEMLEQKTEDSGCDPGENP